MECPSIHVVAARCVTMCTTNTTLNSVYSHETPYTLCNTRYSCENFSYLVDDRLLLETLDRPRCSQRASTMAVSAGWGLGHCFQTLTPTLGHLTHCRLLLTQLTWRWLSGRPSVGWLEPRKKQTRQPCWDLVVHQRSPCTGLVSLP